MKYVLLLLAVIATPAFAQAYKCTINGKTVYADQPCAPNAKSVGAPDDRLSEDQQAQRLQQDAQAVRRDPMWWKHHRLLKDEEYFSKYDRCRYFVVSQAPLEHETRRLYTRQECPTAGQTHSFVDVDCTTLRYRVIGESFQSPETIKSSKFDRWITADGGSSKYALVNFICFPR